ncbi:MAG: small multi-drug export protein [Candidatus Thermoplasmatota archaeon]|nr:small multi-drug export protein [Candidatus Thermoplasmatota archaeon]
MLDFLPVWFKIFFFSMVPWLESRYVIPFTILDLGLEWWQVYPIAVIGNMVPVPFILLSFKHVEKFLRNFKFWANLMDRLFARTRKRADAKIRRYEHLGLLLFVAIPLPFTGAWTGALIAYLFDLKFTKSIITIFIGVLIAATITTVLTVAGIYALS